MAEQFKVDGEYNNNNNEYFKYKYHEAKAFEILFTDDTLDKPTTLKQFRLAAERVVPLRDKRELDTAIDHLKQSLLSRQKHSQRFHYAPLRQRHGHDFWSQLIQHIISLIQPEATEQEQNEEIEDANISADAATFLRFLEDIELCVAQAEALWRRVAAKEMHLSTASMCLYPLSCIKIGFLTYVFK